nr:NADH dehydrogenase subunit 5 [Quadraceps punctatus]
MISFLSLFNTLFGGSVLFSVEISSFEFLMVVDSVSRCFLFMVFSVSAAVLFYMNGYMAHSVFKKKFASLMLLFIFSMVILSLSGDFFSMMVGWDGLGISSFCLIFYYSSWNSMKGSLTTFISNRIGDVFIIFGISAGMMAGSTSSWSVFSSMLGWFLLFGGLTKSAQIPFSAWLPLAMAAPTPVSSLVHSSTLVTAGVFLMVRFFFLFTLESMALLSILSSTTVLLAGTSALSEMDLKKIVALSTLSHISLMFLFISFGWLECALFHMVMHAFFKSLFFMSVGELIHNKDSFQDVRVLKCSMVSASVRLALSVSILSMSGAPLLAGFFSKDYFLMVSSVEGQTLLILFFYISATLTVAYSARVFFLLWNGVLSSPFLKEEKGGNFFLVWTMFSVMGSTYAFWFQPSSGWAPSFEFSFSIPLVFLTGMLLGFTSATSLSSFPTIFMGGGGMWRILSFSLFLVSPIRVGSGFLFNTLDFLGFLSKSSVNFKPSPFTFTLMKVFTFSVPMISTLSLFVFTS